MDPSDPNLMPDLEQNSLWRLLRCWLVCWPRSQLYQAKVDRVRSSLIILLLGSLAHYVCDRVLGGVGYPLYVGSLWYYDRWGGQAFPLTGKHSRASLAASQVFADS